MKVTIHEERIDITELPIDDRIDWDSVLNELKAEHIPGAYQTGRRMGVTIMSGKAHAFIYRTDKTPPEPTIREILKRHGIE
jgi:hypothetical protein